MSKERVTKVYLWNEVAAVKYLGPHQPESRKLSSVPEAPTFIGHSCRRASGRSQRTHRDRTYCIRPRHRALQWNMLKSQRHCWRPGRHVSLTMSGKHI